VPRDVRMQNYVDVAWVIILKDKETGRPTLHGQSRPTLNAINAERHHVDHEHYEIVDVEWVAIAGP
jgi:hypothetical protein